MLEQWQIVATHPLVRANDMSQSVHVLGSGGSVPDGYGVGANGLSDGSEEEHQP